MTPSHPQPNICDEGPNIFGQGAESLDKGQNIWTRGKEYGDKGQIIIMWFLYILRCNDGTFYTGIASDIQVRLDRHNSGRGSRYTKLRRPVELVYGEEFATKSEARNREIEVKKLSSDNKIKLINHGLRNRFPSVCKLK